MSSSSEALKNRALKLVLPKYDKSKVVVWCGSRDTVIEVSWLGTLSTHTNLIEIRTKTKFLNILDNFLEL